MAAKVQNLGTDTWKCFPALVLQKIQKLAFL
jgi:hypothetical protein